MLISCRSLWVGCTVIAFITNIVFSQGQNENGKAQRDVLPNNWKDVFVAGSAGKPTLGTTGATCWARGGICVDIRECPWLVFDGNVPGCMKDFKVCCKSRLQTPSVGHRRKNKINKIPIFSNLEELDQEVLFTMDRNNFKYLGMEALTDN
ncbi:uncharacterized protein LOC113233331 [Hyposmocoma kahamanoa]|uniref:uncharacterized protein LOC113233331 n=1 Tax=Hyposmocoma kahamanoa TaxID=1477025 RepID=UPI000E6DA217|nr:uncharacterized protein LOC113233331 [Hyposmocoma kahamanoa]